MNALGLAVTYCPLTGSSMVFRREVVNGVEFGVSGLLFKNNLVMYDRTGGTPDFSGDGLGRPSGIAFDGNGNIYVSDSESDIVENPGFELGIRIGEVETGWVTDFIPFMWGDPNWTAYGNGAEFVTVDSDGNIYGGEPRPRNLQKYVRVRP